MWPLRFSGLVSSLVLPMALAAALAQAQVPGRNINMVSGTDWPDGDPFLQRQNEPSIAVSTRNPMHLLAGANDYRTVDLPGLPDDVVTGDAWLGVFTSYDGGATWKSTLLPGYPQEVELRARRSMATRPPRTRRCAPARTGSSTTRGSRSTATTPSILAKAGRPPRRKHRAGGHAEGATSAVFVARFIDNNNKENGEPIAYLSTKVVATTRRRATSSSTSRGWRWTCRGRARGPARSPRPWVERPSPRPSPRATSTWPTASSRTDAGGEFLGSVYFARSTNCGGTWSTPVKISGTHHISQGATIAIDPRTGTVYVAWRRFAWPRPPATPQEGDAILLARSLDRGVTLLRARGRGGLPAVRPGNGQVPLPHECLSHRWRWTGTVASTSPSAPAACSNPMAMLESS